MGPIPSDGGPPRYLCTSPHTRFLRSSKSNNPGSYALAKSSVLLVSLPDVSLPGAWRGIQAVQATSTNVTASGLISSMETPTIFLERLLDHRFAHIVGQ